VKTVLAAIAKNEGPYLAEWLVHHHRIGFDEIVVYDNDSSDETAEVLRFFAGRMNLRAQTWPTLPGVSPQISAYNDVLDSVRADGTWIAFFDLDEFLVPTGDFSLAEAIARCATAGAGAIGVNQRVFGSNGLEQMERRPVLDRFRRCTLERSGECFWPKSIYHSRCVPRITNVHVSQLAEGVYLHPNGEPIVFAEPPKHPTTTAVDYSVLQLNHYITKSLQEFMAKRLRGGAASSDPEVRRKRYEDVSFFHNRQFVSNKVEWEGAEAHAAANLDLARRLAVPQQVAGGLAALL
jgi:glycosyltransferase involved in cell wall biosynthesis